MLIWISECLSKPEGVHSGPQTCLSRIKWAKDVFRGPLSQGTFHVAAVARVLDGPLAWCHGTATCSTGAESPSEYSSSVAPWPFSYDVDMTQHCCDAIPWFLVMSSLFETCSRSWWPNKAGSSLTTNTTGLKCFL